MSENKVYKEGYKDGIKFAILAARAYGNNEELIKRLEREYSGEDGETAVKLVYGETYLIYEKRNQKGMEIILGVATQGFPAIVMSRDTKSTLTSMKNIKFAPITYDESVGSFNPTQLSQMQEYVISNLIEKGVVYIDCLDYIFSTSSSVQNVLRFLTVLKDKVLDKNGIFILSLNKDAIGKPELSMIEKEFKNTIKIKSD
ncbi:MAG: DUF835 domain-containing protein [Candidatus Thermoplasmatota archaeon]|jgi:hypothetical protein|nr:DUF835 domain-containing protein [Candidatus Thermoplasmatota archaeon]